MSESEAVKRVDSGAMAADELPSLADFDESSGLHGWYEATVLEGYATQKGTQFVTGDGPGQNGRRELRLCFALAVGRSTRNLQRTFFYAPENFTVEGLTRIKELREQFRNQRSWPGHGHDQNFSINLGHLGQLEKAVGFKLQNRERGNPSSGFVTAPYVGKRLDVYVAPGKNEYDEIKGFAAAGTRAKRS